MKPGEYKTAAIADVWYAIVNNCGFIVVVAGTEDSAWKLARRYYGDRSMKELKGTHVCRLCELLIRPAPVKAARRAGVPSREELYAILKARSAELQSQGVE